MVDSGTASLNVQVARTYSLIATLCAKSSIHTLYKLTVGQTRSMAGE